MRAGADDDGLPVVEQLLGDGHAPIMSLIESPHVDDVPGSHGRLAPRALHDEPPSRVDAGGASGQCLAGREVHPDVAADGHAGGDVRRPQAGGPARLPRVVLLPEPGEDREQQAGPVGGGPRRDRQRGGGRHRELVGGGADVQPDADDRGRAGRRLDALDQDAGGLEVAEEHVVRPLHPRLDPGVPQRPGHGEPGQQRQPRPLLGTDGRAQQHREGERGAGRRLPGPVQPAAAGGLVLGDDHEALRRAVAGPRRDEGVGRGGGVDHLDRQVRSRPGQAVPVEGWACGGVIGHGHYIGPRHPRRPDT